MTTCILHGDWGIECGPDCKRLTDLWNEGCDCIYHCCAGQCCPDECLCDCDGELT